ncbi:MAG: hypothetical protein M1813_000609 [Trichoglossum hirsutum]|nr:MAG: hypothetical protein M1813_000609 [Trichoglossum hirsutum]
MVLGREFSKKTDYIHIPGQFDMEHRICWIVLDFNVKKRGSDTEQIPLYYFKVNYRDENSADFRLSSRNARPYTCKVIWGCDDEERLARMDEREAEDEKD